MGVQKLMQVAWMPAWMQRLPRWLRVQLPLLQQQQQQL
jgi:hypothetical protein